MSISPQASTDHYDDAYYGSHYGRFLQDVDYGSLLGIYYAEHIFRRLAPGKHRVLDYGAGLGHLSSAVSGDCYDPSEFAQRYIERAQRTLFRRPEDIPTGAYDVVFSSHAIEHAPHPGSEFVTIRRVLKEKSALLLILPMEAMPGHSALKPDDNMHLHAWNFQCITNLLTSTGFDVRRQEVFYGPFGLNHLSRWLPRGRAIRLAALCGRLKRQYPSLLTLATKR